MSRTLALWPGPSPGVATRACRDYSSRMIRHGITWSRTGTVPDQDPGVLAFCRTAARQLRASAAGRVSPWRVPAEFGTLWGDVLTLELGGSPPVALAILARLAEDHGLVLFDLSTHRLLTTADISTVFGEPMVPAPAQPSVVDLATRCMERWTCIDDLHVLSEGLLCCAEPVDPFLVTPVQQELERFEQVLDLLGCHDLEALKERLDDLLLATEDMAGADMEEW